MTSLPRRWLRFAQRLLPPGNSGTMVLAYHLVGGGTDSPVDLPIETFRSHLEQLKRLAHVVRLSETEQERPGGRRPRVALTFDDAFANFYDRAWPLLEQLALPSTLFVPVGFVAGEAPSPLRGAEHLPAAGWRQLQRLADSGLVEIGSHTSSHPDLRRLSAPDLEDELRGSKATLEQRLGRPVTSLAYPRGLWNRRVAERARHHYRRAVTGGGRRAHPSRTDPLRLPRLPVRRELADLGNAISARLWLEEWGADLFRRWRAAS